MAITSIPEVRGGPNTGGVVYGLNINMGYSSAPSKLTLDIVSKDGNYSLPTLNSKTSITFGDFNFNGIIWSYNLKETSEEKTLQVTIIDNSVILDRYYVLLWKRGLLGQMGRDVSIAREFDFSSESIIAPAQNTDKVIPYTEFTEKKLSKQSISRKSKSLGGARVGSVLLVGHEKFSDSECDIPDTYYTFNDLKNILPFQGVLPSNNTWKATHEGTLREVLSSWAADLGYDFYWDFSLNTIVFYSVSKGVTSRLPNSSASNIISKETSSSMEGTFRQYGLAYTAMPKKPIKALQFSGSKTILYATSPYSIDYFARKMGGRQSLDASREVWGGKRKKQDFIHAGLLGYVSRSLRDLHCFQNKHWEALGYTVDSGIAINKPSIITFLKRHGFQDMVSNYESFDKEGLPNYEFNFISADQALADKWFEMEQSLLQYHGKYYRCSDRSGSFFYCNSSYTAQIDISVDPEGQFLEDNNQEFMAQRVIDRNGSMSHDSASAQEALGIEKLSTEIQNCAPMHINLKESGIADALVLANIITKENLAKINTLVMFPHDEKFVKAKLGFDSRMSRATHPTEPTITEIKNANIQSGRKNCADYDAKLAEGACVSAEEEARNKAIKAAGGQVDDSQGEDDFISGLTSNSAHVAKITLKNSSLDLFAPSDGRMQVVCRYNISINKISAIDATKQFLWSVGSPGGADDVAELRIANENVTDPSEDSYKSSRTSEIIRPADAESVTPQETIKYVFAGMPNGVNLSPSVGLTSLDVSLSSDGFTTTATYSTKPSKPSRSNNMVRYVNSQFNRASYNAS